MTTEVAACEHGVKGCIHTGKTHDDDDCFNGMWYHRYVCQECGNVMQSSKFSMRLRPDGMYQPPSFPAKDCSKCGSEKSLT